MADGGIPEVQKAFDGLQKTFGEFQAKNDAALKDLKKGQTDVVRREELARINTAIDKAKDEINALWRKNARPAIATTGAAAAVETKALAEFAKWMGADDPTSAKVVDAHRAYKRAYRDWIRKGLDGMTDVEKKTLQVGEAPSGGFWVEPAMADWIITKIFETSIIRPYARGITITTDSVKVPVDRQRTTARWVGELSSRTPTVTAQVGEMMISVHELMSQPALTQNMIDDSSVDVETWAQDKIAQDFMLSENSAFVNGNGTFQPRGFLTYPVQTLSDQGGRAFGTVETIQTGVSGNWKTATATVNPADDIIALIYSFKAPYRPGLRFGGTRTTLRTVRQFKDQLGNYIAGPRLDKDKGLVETVFGFDWDEWADMPELGANSLSVVMADWTKAYLIVDKSGIRQLRDPYTSKPLTLLDTSKRVGGDVMDTEAIKLIKFG